jgi:hypothetical protein
MPNREMDKDVLRLSYAGDAPVVLRTEHEAIGEEAREEMLARLARGEHVEVFLDAVTFSQAPGVRNRKFVRFSEDRLVAIAKSGKGNPFLRDHAQWSMGAVGGVIVASEARENGKAIEFVQTARLVEVWAVRMALLGLMKAFSIGWDPLPLPGKLQAEILCSVCMAPINNCVWELGHWRGKVVAGQVVEVIFRNAELLESSAVPVPAVREVHPIGVRSALALDGERVQAELEAIGLHVPRREKAMDLEAILSALGLASGGGEKEILAALQQRDAEARAKMGAQQQQLEAARAEALAATARAQAAEAKASNSEEQLADEKARQWADGLVAEGKLAPSGELYVHWVEQYKLNPEKAQRLADALPRVTPVGKGEAQSERKAKKGGSLKADGTPDYAALALQLDAPDRDAATKYGLSVEDYVRFNRESLADQYGWDLKGA